MLIGMDRGPSVLPATPVLRNTPVDQGTTVILPGGLNPQQQSPQ